MINRNLVSMILVLQFCATAIVFADYTVVLKNGRRMTVESYREEGATIKVPAFGGELGIPKEQIETISNAEHRKGQGLNISDSATSNREAQTVQKSTPIS